MKEGRKEEFVTKEEGFVTTERKKGIIYNNWKEGRKDL